MQKGMKIAGLVLAGLVVLIVLAMLVYALIQPLLYREYYKEARREFVAAGLDDGLVPQGFSYVPGENLFLQCGYMTDGVSASRIYVADREGNTRYVELLAPDGSPYCGHTGGIAVGEQLVWLANDGEGEDNCVWVLPLAEVLNGTVKQITLSHRFYPESRAAYCYVDQGLLWVGEFYDPAKYPTKESHRVTTNTGEVNHAFVCAYPIDETQETGVAGTVPQKILSVTAQVQGFAVNAEGAFALSASYGTATSHLYLYENVTAGEADAYVPVEGVSVPVWYLDSESLVKAVEMPPMSEEIVCVDDRVYILFESASRKYLFGLLMRGRGIYSFPF